MANARRRGIGLLIGTGVIWGTIGISAKLLYEETTLDAAAVTWLRTVIAAPACIALAWATLGRRILAATRADLTLMAGLGIVLIVYQFTYLASVDRIGVAVATLVSLCVPPMLIAAYSALFQGERLSGRALAALAGAVVGTVMLVGWGAAESTGRTLVVGVGLALASATMIAAHFLCSRSLAGRQPPLRPLAIAFGVGAVAFAPAGLRSDITLDLPLESWVVLLYLALVPSILAYWLFQSALKDVSASTASVVTLTEPLVASVLAWVLFSERLGPVGWIGAVLLMGAIALLTIEPVVGEHPEGSLAVAPAAEPGAGLD